MSDATDVLGVKGVSDSIKIMTEGARAFLSKVCMPAAEEFGLALQDQIKAWRAKNAAQIFSTANRMLGDKDVRNQQLAPRLAHLAFEEGSWCDDEMIQKMWAGLLVSSLSENGKSDETLIFMNLLKNLSSTQVRVLNYAAQKAEKYDVGMGLPMAEGLVVPIQELAVAVESNNIQQLDVELDHLREIGLIGDHNQFGGISGGIYSETELADVTPRALTLHLYVRSQGSKVPPVEYWKLKPKTKPQTENPT